MFEALRQEIIKRVQAKIDDGYKLTPDVFFSCPDRCGCLVGLAIDRTAYRNLDFARQLKINRRQESAIEAGFCGWVGDRNENLPFYKLGEDLRAHFDAQIVKGLKG